MDPEERFDALVAELADEPGVQPPSSTGKRLFGARTLKVDGSIFAMLSHGALVVKLPAARVEQLIADGTGIPFDAGKGRPMRGWLTLANNANWPTLAREALIHVRPHPTMEP